MLSVPFMGKFCKQFEIKVPEDKSKHLSKKRRIWWNVS